MSTEQDRLTLIVLHEDGKREKFRLRSWVGLPRKGELFWLGDDPFVVIEIEYAAVDGLFGVKSIEAAGIYVRRLSDDEQHAVARRLSGPVKGKDDVPFRP